MSSPGVRRLIASFAALALAGFGLVATAGSAQAFSTPGYEPDANSIGSLKFFNASGQQITGGTNLAHLADYIQASATAGTGYTKATLYFATPDHTKATGAWTTSQQSASTSYPNAAAPAPLNTGSLPLVTLGAADGDLGSVLATATLDTTAGYANYFQIRVKLSGGTGVAATAYFASDISFNQAAGTWAVEYPTAAASSIATTTTVSSVTPASQNVAGGTTGSVSATATVSPSTAAGTIQFKVDGVNSGSPVTGASGSATATLTGLSGSLTPGTNHVVTAAFTAATPAANTVGYADSASTNTATNATIVWNAADATTTNLALSSANINYGVDTLTATATVTVTAGGAAATSGSVQFKVDGNNVGSPVTVSGSGVAAATISTGSLTASATPGTAHTVTAAYTDGNTYGSSTSSNASFNLIVWYSIQPDFIRTSISAGTLDLSTALTISTPLLLPSMTLSTSADEYFSSLLITGLSMTDTRPGNLPYTLSLISTNLNKLGVANPNPNESISGQNVGFNVTSLVSTNATPNTFLGSQNPGASTTGQNFTGFNNAAAAHVQITDTGSQGLGGSTPHPILHANQGTGTTVVAATMTIRAPTNLLDGTYAGTVTFSVLGS